MNEAPDLIFVNGQVLTVNESNDVVEALAVRDGVIVAVGDANTIKAMADATTRVVDLDGGTLLPGINDSHIHAVSLGTLTPPFTLDVSYPAVRSIADVVEAVRAAAATRAPGEWIMGVGWDLGFLDEYRADPSRLPTRHDLDAVSPNNPVFLQDFSFHAGWVNSAALVVGGFDLVGNFADDPMVVSDDDGHPTGVLYERVQIALRACVPVMTSDQRLQAVRNVQRRLSSLGVTSITDPAIGPADPNGAMGTDGLESYLQLVSSGEATVRTNVLRFVASMSSSLDELAKNLAAFGSTPTPDSRMFQVVGTKIFADGIPPNKTAWMKQDYVGGGRGALTIAGETDEEREAELRRMIQHAHDHGGQVGVHVTGDRSVVAVVHAFVAAMENSPRPDPRHYLIHSDFLAAPEMELCAKYGIGSNMNPSIKWTIADLQVGFVGRDLADYEWPYRSAIDAGVVVCSSSDAPVTMPDWRQGVSTMILRKSKATGDVFGPEQCITLMEAIRTYTINPAWQDRAENWKGSLEVGKVADLCMVRENLLDTDPHEIPDVTVTMTVLGGRVVYQETEPVTPRSPAPAEVLGHYGSRVRIAYRPDMCCPYDALVLG